MPTVSDLLQGPVGRHASLEPTERFPIPAAGAAPLRIVFMGTPDFAVPCLQALIDGPDEVIGVVARPDMPAGRGQKMVSPPTIQLAREHGIRTFQPKALKSGPFPEALGALGADLFVVVAYGRILPSAILEMPRLGCINVHASLLPRLRGAGPIQWSVLRGDAVSGVTTMWMDEGMDTGDMLRVAELPLRPDETGQSLHDKLSVLGAALLRETLDCLHRGSLTFTPQPHDGVTFAPMLKKEDGAIDWSRPARELDWHVRGMHPWPGAFTFRAKTRLVIEAGEVHEAGADAAPGAVLSASPAGIDVATGDGVYRITRVKPAGKKAMAAGDYARGHAFERGERLGPEAGAS